MKSANFLGSIIKGRGFYSELEIPGRSDLRDCSIEVLVYGLKLPDVEMLPGFWALVEIGRFSFFNQPSMYRIARHVDLTGDVPLAQTIQPQIPDLRLQSFLLGLPGAARPRLGVEWRWPSWYTTRVKQPHHTRAT